MSTTKAKPNASPVDPAQELVAELHRNPDIIPPYNVNTISVLFLILIRLFQAELMQECINNVTELTEMNKTLL